MKYIGITGHRGSGKTSVAYLLGNILNMLKKKKSKEDIYENYKCWCELIKHNNNIIYDCDLDYIYFDEFGELPKSFTAQLLSVDIDLLDSDFMKDNMYVNMKDFKLHTYDKSYNIMTHKELLTNAPNIKKWKDVYVSLRDFITYFSIDIMQTYFGNNVWLKTRKANDEKFGGTNEKGWKIFSDVKTAEEIKYIKDNDGIIIRALRPTNRKNNNGISNIEDYDSDIIIITEGELINLFEQFFKMANKIYNNEKGVNNTI